MNRIIIPMMVFPQSGGKWGFMNTYANANIGSSPDHD
jgi:hypothetical protein